MTDRVNFSKDEDEDEGDVSAKMHVICDIKAGGLEPLYVIHRHGLSEREAYLVEAAVIDAHAGLTNIMGGHGSDEFGPASVEQLVERYSAAEMILPAGYRLMAISINKSHTDLTIEDTVSCAWKVSLSRAQRATQVLAMIGGVCRGVFIPERWLPATKANFQRLVEDRLGGYGLAG